MKSASDALKALLALDEFHMADLYTLVLVDETILRYTTADVDLVASTFNFATGLWERQTFRSAPSLFERTQITWKMGLEVDTVDIDAYPDQADLVGGLPFIQALEQGMFDGTEVQIERCFMPISDFMDTSAGSVILWSGRMGDLDGFGRTNAPLRANSHLELLNIKMPRNTYQPACIHTLYDCGCGVSKAVFQVAGTVGAGATVSVIPVPGTGAADGWFDQGIIVAGGESRTIKKWASDQVTVIVPFRTVPSGAVLLYPGCDKTMATCAARFNNLANFRGQPFVPIPETGV